MSPRRFAVAFALMVALAAISRANDGDATGPAPIPADEPVTLAVVSTWDDLAAQPPIKLAGGREVRLGIESATLPRNGSVLVYLMTEGGAMRVQHPDQLGPLMVRVTAEGVARDALLEAMQDRPIPQRGRVVFARSIHAESDGAHTVELLDGERVVAKARFTIGPAGAVVWWPLRRPGDGQRGIDDATYFEELSPDLSVPATPYVEGVEPVIVRPGGKAPRPDRQALPRALPDPQRHDAKLSVTRASGEFWLTLELPAQTTLGDLDNRLLVRWFVNGEPVVAPRAAAKELQAEQNGWGGHIGNRVRVELVVPEGTFGQFGGERVEAQVMWCPHGFKHAGELAMLRRMKPVHVEQDGQRLTTPILSNRVEFQIPHKVAMRTR